MIPKEIRQRTDEELEALEKRLGDELFNARMQNATGHPDMGKIRKVKKDLARVKTIIKERQLKIR
jgi:large subunit ribosomal protein L29